jgi:hypothetical protein
MLEAILILAVLALVVTAAVFGADSRDGDDWVTHPPA